MSSRGDQEKIALADALLHELKSRRTCPGPKTTTLWNGLAVLICDIADSRTRPVGDVGHQDGWEDAISTLREQAVECFQQGDDENAQALRMATKRLEQARPEPRYPPSTTGFSVESALRRMREHYDKSVGRDQLRYEIGK